MYRKYWFDLIGMQEKISIWWPNTFKENMAIHPTKRPDLKVSIQRIYKRQCIVPAEIGNVNFESVITLS